MSAEFDHVIEEVPLRLRRRVNWGECDPAGVVYTPHFVDYVVDASMTLLERLIGSPLRTTLKRLDLDIPAKAVNIEFRRSLWPEQIFELSVRIGEIRSRTFDVNVHAVTADGEDVFRGTLALICTRNGVREARPIPETIRQQFIQYRDRSDARHPIAPVNP